MIMRKNRDIINNTYGLKISCLSGVKGMEGDTLDAAEAIRIMERSRAHFGIVDPAEKAETVTVRPIIKKVSKDYRMNKVGNDKKTSGEVDQPEPRRISARGGPLSMMEPR